MTPRFPPRDTPEYWQAIEERLILENEDNNRQWILLREIGAKLTGLGPIQVIATAGFAVTNFGSGSGGGSGVGSGDGSGSGTGS
jgi:hypothetical protein